MDFIKQIGRGVSKFGRDVSKSMADPALIKLGLIVIAIMLYGHLMYYYTPYGIIFTLIVLMFEISRKPKASGDDFE
tara:strand:- start:1467 stop:1694 length:228 start_codon:yes stop_codon:yes gene_type:complete